MFKKNAIIALNSIEIDPDEFLQECCLAAQPKYNGSMSVTYEGVVYEYTVLGKYDYFWLGARVKGDKNWTEIAVFTT